MQFLFSLLSLTFPVSAQIFPALPKCNLASGGYIQKCAYVGDAGASNYITTVSVEHAQMIADYVLQHIMLTATALSLVVVAPTAVVTPPVVEPPHHRLLPYVDVGKIPAPEVGFATSRIRATTDTTNPNENGSGQFRTVCKFSHMNFDDPIVFPGKQGAAHLHTFFGNTAVNFASTQASIETTGNSTCSGGTANRTGYWVPSIIDTKDGTPIKPESVMVYYKTGYIEGDNVKPFPAGLRMIAGDMRSVGPQEHIDWGCQTDLGDGPRSKTIGPNCPVGNVIEASIEFPFCWDGVNLDSPDHKSHMSFQVWNNDTRKLQCPTTHPVELPMITEKIRYRVTEEGSTSRWRLVSDNYDKTIPGGYSLHADWFNGWDAKVLETWVKNCLQANRDCHVDLLGDGTALF